MLTYKRKLILTKAQELRLDSWIGACRFVYNMALEIRREVWKNKQYHIHKFELIKQLATIKDVDWIADTPAASLVDSVERLDFTYKTFFKGGGFPKWATSGKYKSILFKQARKKWIRIENGKINIPKMGFIKMFKDSPVFGNIKIAVIKKEPTGYFIFITTDTTKNIQSKDESQVIGLDMGITHLFVDSNGQFINNPKHFKKYEQQLRIEHRSLTRKKRGSNSWRRQCKRFALLHHKIGNIRRDFLHKESTKIAQDNHTVFIEDLNIKNMSKNGKFAKHILDCGWGAFRIMLEYKTNVVAINPKYTSQTCNDCGAKDAKSRISQSKFVCTSCGVESNADINAAKNIRDKGIVIARQREAIACA